MAIDCRNCGAVNDDNAWKCVKCGQVLPHPEEPASPVEREREEEVEVVPNYLVHAILATLLCCPPLGIPAIVFAAQVNVRAEAGDLQGAWEASHKAKLWAWASFAGGLVLTLVYAMLVRSGAVRGL